MPYHVLTISGIVPKIVKCDKRVSQVKAKVSELSKHVETFC